MDYQWDAAKARFNLQKHGIDFADAVGVFDDYQTLINEALRQYIQVQDCLRGNLA